MYLPIESGINSFFGLGRTFKFSTISRMGLKLLNANLDGLICHLLLNEFIWLFTIGMVTQDKVLINFLGLKIKINIACEINY